MRDFPALPFTPPPRTVAHGDAQRVTRHGATSAPRALPPAGAADTTRDQPQDAERQLVRRAVDGDPAAERALYDAHVTRVYRLAFRLAGDDDLARDITQDTFVRAFERLADFRHDAAFGTWLHRITVSVALNRLDQVRRRHGREAPLDEGLAAAAPDRRADPDLTVQLTRAVDALPAGYRTVFVMHDVEGYTHDEIGAVLGVSPGTSKSQLSHARAQLRRQLAAFRREDS